MFCWVGGWLFFMLSAAVFRDVFVSNSGDHFGSGTVKMDVFENFICFFVNVCFPFRGLGGLSSWWFPFIVCPCANYLRLCCPYFFIGEQFGSTIPTGELISAFSS